MDLARNAGLQFPPEVAGGKLASLCSDRVLVRTAAVYLATVLEYLVDDDSGGNEGLREEEEADEPEWSGGMVGESVLADMELEARLRRRGEEFAPEAGGQ